MVTTEITMERFISQKQDALALDPGSTIAVSMVGDFMTCEAYATRSQHRRAAKYAIYNVYYRRALKYFSTLAYLSPPLGQAAHESNPPDANRIYKATVVGKYPETAESMLCFTARRLRLAINRHHPQITKAMRLSAAAITGVKIVNIYPADLVIYERDVTLVSHGVSRFVFAGDGDPVQSDDLATVELAAFAHLLIHELTY